MVIVTNFQSPKEIEDLEDRFYNGGGYTNLEILEDGAKIGWAEWTVDKSCEVGDIVILMCAKTAKDHMEHVCTQAKGIDDIELIRFAKLEREKYKKYSGYLLGTGRISESPFQGYSEYQFKCWQSPWYAKISDIKLFDCPIYIDEFRDFIKVSRTGAITKLSNDQWEQLRDLIVEKNDTLNI